uniref:BRCA1-A complex subunit RAP80 n=1 Tax=Echeneis naucrates TaxID=173247 RepID=A0A665TND1_ECHNA
MPLRKQPVKDVSDVPSENTEEHDADGDDQVEVIRIQWTELNILSYKTVSPLICSCRTTFLHHFYQMTEEEMMDLALRLSEQEATKTALRVQQEEEAVMKAIEESVSSRKSSAGDAGLVSDSEVGLTLQLRVFISASGLTCF